jgi:hypothetical protein
MESGDTLEGSVELLDFFGTNTSVLGEEVESLRVVIECLNIGEVFINGIEGLLLRGSGEENTGISSLDGILGNWGFVIWGTVDLLDASDTESTKQILLDVWSWLRGTGTREVYLLSGWSWSCDG